MNDHGLFGVIPFVLNFWSSYKLRAHRDSPTRSPLPCSSPGHNNQLQPGRQRHVFSFLLKLPHEFTLWFKALAFSIVGCVLLVIDKRVQAYTSASRWYTRQMRQSSRYMCLDIGCNHFIARVWIEQQNLSTTTRYVITLFHIPNVDS